MTSSSSPVAIITGASSGIGEATARLLAEKGYRVALAARRLERLEALAKEIQSAGGEALVVQTDITVLADIERMIKTTLDAWGQIDVLVNNAGFGRLKWLETLDPQKDIEQQIDVNLWGVIQATRAVLPHMLARRQGLIINVSSVAGWIALPTYSIYNATKYGVRGFTEAMHRELRGTGIRVCGVYPGPVATEFNQHTGSEVAARVKRPGFLVLSAEDVARSIWRLTRRPRRAVMLPAYYWPAAWIAFFFPGVVDWILGRVFRR